MKSRTKLIDPQFPLNVYLKNFAHECVFSWKYIHKFYIHLFLIVLFLFFSTKLFHNDNCSRRSSVHEIAILVKEGQITKIVQLDLNLLFNQAQ